MWSLQHANAKRAAGVAKLGFRSRSRSRSPKSKAAKGKPRSRSPLKLKHRQPKGRRLGGGENVALLVIDVQRDFCELPVPATTTCPKHDVVCSEDCVAKDIGSLSVSGTTKSSDLFANVNTLQRMASFSHRIASQDWHPGNHMSFARNKEGAKPFATLSFTNNRTHLPYNQCMWPAHCVQDTAGAEIVDQVDPMKDRTLPPFSLIVKKATKQEFDGYSAFGDGLTDRGVVKMDEDTGLLKYLHKNGITHLVVCGIATDYCVKETVLDALAYGFKVTLALDACRGVDASRTPDVVKTMSDADSVGTNFQALTTNQVVKLFA
jgi:nicotinamidase/pyrazinamidase